MKPSLSLGSLQITHFVMFGHLFPCILLLAGALFVSCNSSENNNGLLLAKDIKKQQCAIDSLVQLNRADWQEAMVHFENSLPADLPEKERATMLTLTNGELIRMFNSYDRLEDSTKDIIDEMESKDKGYAATIKELRKEIDLLKAQLTDYLEVSNPDDHVKNQIDKILNHKCN